VLIGGVAASSLAPLLRPLPAGAAAPVAGKQAPGFYRYKVGSFECTSLNDGALTYPISADYVTNVSKDQSSPPPRRVLSEGHGCLPYNPQVINTGSKLVLIDTGWGRGRSGGRPRAAQHGRCRTRAGAVDTVIISHFHRDHINGLRKADGALAFRTPKSRSLRGVGVLDERRQHVEGVWQHDAGQLRQRPPDIRRACRPGDEVRVGQEVVPGSSPLRPGHTPGTRRSPCSRAPRASSSSPT